MEWVIRESEKSSREGREYTSVMMGHSELYEREMGQHSCQVLKSWVEKRRTKRGEWGTIAVQMQAGYEGSHDTSHNDRATHI